MYVYPASWALETQRLPVCPDLCMRSLAQVKVCDFGRAIRPSIVTPSHARLTAQGERGCSWLEGVQEGIDVQFLSNRGPIPGASSVCFEQRRHNHLLESLSHV